MKSDEIRKTPVVKTNEKLNPDRTVELDGATGAPKEGRKENGELKSK